MYLFIYFSLYSFVFYLYLLNIFVKANVLDNFFFRIIWLIESLKNAIYLK